jgi:NAD(P)-dependent dehydrogenase (short-subunit alcohol dehydrogenase family)
MLSALSDTKIAASSGGYERSTSPSTMPDEKVKHFGTNTLVGRPAQPAELAPVYVFLASDEASYVTGEIYGVTGGRMQM